MHVTNQGAKYKYGLSFDKYKFIFCRKVWQIVLAATWAPVAETAGDTNNCICHLLFYQFFLGLIFSKAKVQYNTVKDAEDEDDQNQIFIP